MRITKFGTKGLNEQEATEVTEKHWLCWLCLLCFLYSERSLHCIISFHRRLD